MSHGSRSKPGSAILPRPFALLLLSLLFVLAAFAFVGQDARSRRTATADVEISSVQVRPSPYRGSPGDAVIRYRFLASGQGYDRVAIRSWTPSVIGVAKVCYEPADPNNQVLVERSAPCP